MQFPCGRCKGGKAPRDNQEMPGGSVVGCLRCYDSGIDPVKTDQQSVLDGSPTTKIVGKKGKLTAEQRSEIARKAAMTRWNSFR